MDEETKKALEKQIIAVRRKKMTNYVSARVIPISFLAIIIYVLAGLVFTVVMDMNPTRVWVGGFIAYTLSIFIITVAATIKSMELYE